MTISHSNIKWFNVEETIPTSREWGNAEVRYCPVWVKNSKGRVERTRFDFLKREFQLPPFRWGQKRMKVMKFWAYRREEDESK